MSNQLDWFWSYNSRSLQMPILKGPLAPRCAGQQEGKRVKVSLLSFIKVMTVGQTTLMSDSHQKHAVTHLKEIHLVLLVKQEKKHG